MKDEINIEEVLSKIQEAAKPIIEEVKQKQKNGSILVYNGKVDKQDVSEKIDFEIGNFLIQIGWSEICKSK